MRKNLLDSDDAFKTQNMLELARLYKVVGNYSAANAEFEKAIPMLVDLQIEYSGPLGYATTLKDYVITLNEVGSVEKARIIQSEIDALITKNPGRTSNYVARTFPTEC